MTLVVAEHRPYTVKTVTRHEMTTEIITCAEHAPKIDSIGKSMKGFLAQRLRERGKLPPYVYLVEQIPLTDDRARQHFAGKPN